MLVRRNADGTRECIHQEHHALISGRLAARWKVDFPAPLIAAITLHDTPWREVDREPEFDEERRDVLDFVRMPAERRLAFYQDGLDDLEMIDPYVAYLTSRHYTAFAGTRHLEDFQRSESVRRARLAARFPDGLEPQNDALRWLQFFDVLSLWICLTGPDTDPDEIPPWLEATEHWTALPDGSRIALSWESSAQLVLEPWPFRTEELSIDVSRKRFRRPATAAALTESWNETRWDARSVEFARR